MTPRELRRATGEEGLVKSQFALELLDVLDRHLDWTAAVERIPNQPQLTALGQRVDMRVGNPERFGSFRDRHEIFLLSHSAIVTNTANNGGIDKTGKNDYTDVTA